MLPKPCDMIANISAQRFRSEETSDKVMWCVVLLMRYLGTIWGPGYLRKCIRSLSHPEGLSNMPTTDIPARLFSIRSKSLKKNPERVSKTAVGRVRNERMFSKRHHHRLAQELGPGRSPLTGELAPYL